jgi:serine/threonine-protein kinase
MEYLKGESLKERIRRMGWLSVWECIEMAMQVALGLQATHKQGIVHRDVSPGNILMVPDDGEEVAKLIDFGIAKSMGPTASTKITGTMEIIGKAAYCSPEQIQAGSADEIDGRSDIYSFGVTLFEMLTGERPFDSKNAQEFLAMHLQREPRTIAEVNELVHVPPGFADLVMRMLRKDRRDRPASAEELHSELSALHDEYARPSPVH